MVRIKRLRKSINALANFITSYFFYITSYNNVFNLLPLNKKKSSKSSQTIQR